MVDHVILTRFNLPSGGSEALIRSRDGWLTSRVSLFERYCLPSLQMQTCRNFGWIVYFDPASPDWLRERIAKWSEERLLTAIFRESVTKDEMISDIQLCVGRNHKMLMTTNIDNDDAVAVDFVERLQRSATAKCRTAVYLANGLILTGDRIYANRDPDNAFCSVLEPWDDARMCWSDWHNMLHLSMPVQVVEGAPAWLQVVHGDNVSNRVKGRRQSPSLYEDLFPGMLDSMPEPKRSERLLEALVDAPKRRVADRSRQALKRVILSLSGKEGLARVRLLAKQLRH